MAIIHVISVGDNTPPSSPIFTQKWYIGKAPTGAWASGSGCIAEWTVTGWIIALPSIEDEIVSAADGSHYTAVNGIFTQTIGPVSGFGAGLLIPLIVDQPEDGRDGQSGTDGRDGAAGAAGAAGAVGNAGNDGRDGDTGESGRDGFKELTVPPGRRE